MQVCVQQTVLSQLIHLLYRWSHVSETRYSVNLHFYYLSFPCYLGNWLLSIILGANYRHLSVTRRYGIITISTIINVLHGLLMVVLLLSLSLISEPDCTSQSLKYNNNNVVTEVCSTWESSRWHYRLFYDLKPYRSDLTNSDNKLKVRSVV